MLTMSTMSRISSHTKSCAMAALAILALTWSSAVHAQSRAPSAPDRVVALLTGTEQRLSTDFAVGNTAIGNPGVCAIEVLSGQRELLLTARGIGQTTLTLWDQQGRKQEEIQVDVSERAPSKLQNDLAALLSPYPGVRAEPLGDRVVLSGTVASQEALAAVQNIAEAAGVASVVTLGGSLPFSEGNRPTGSAPPGGAAMPQPVAPRSLLPADAALPVALTSAGPETRPSAAPATPVTMLSGSALADDDGAPPSAAPNPPPPNVFYVPASGQSDSLGFGTGLTGGRSATGSSPMPPAAAAGLGGGRVEYRVDLYQQSAMAPPPEVMGPQGTKIFGTTLTAFQGQSARELIVADPGGRSADGGTRPMSGLSIEVTPTISGGTISTVMTIDTNLPIGVRDTPGPHPWRRAQLQFEVGAGATRYMTEQELAGLMSSAGSPSPSVAGGGAGQVGVAGGVPGSQVVPVIGGLFRLGGGGVGSRRQDNDDQPKDDRRLVIVVSAVLGASR